jgi:hypothetical protein
LGHPTVGVSANPEIKVVLRDVPADTRQHVAGRGVHVDVPAGALVDVGTWLDCERTGDKASCALTTADVTKD